MGRLLALYFAAFFLTAGTAFAGDTESVFGPGPRLQLAHEDPDRRNDAQAEDEAPTEEEIRQRKRELREEARELREQERELRRRERDRAARRNLRPRAWLGLGVGGGVSHVDLVCSPSDYFCDEEGEIATYNANITFAGPRTIFRARGMRVQDKGSDHARTPYEMAALIGGRFGHSNWFGLVGAGRILHAHDDLRGDQGGVAWAIVFAPSTAGGPGLELAFEGNFGDRVQFGLVNLGLRFGALR